MLPYFQLFAGACTQLFLLYPDIFYSQLYLTLRQVITLSMPLKIILLQPKILTSLAIMLKACIFLGTLPHGDVITSFLFQSQGTLHVTQFLYFLSSTFMQESTRQVSMLI